MDRREELHDILVDILGSENVYYQPPESVKMHYPAIRYSRSDIVNTFANNNVYAQKYAYEIVLIDSNPDSETVFKLSQLPKIRFQRHYVANNLNHDVYQLFY